MRSITLSIITITSLAHFNFAQAAGETKEISTAENTAVVSDFASSNNEELIVAVLYRKQEPLSDGLVAYALNGDIALPLEQLMFLVEFPVKLSGDARTASGWFIREGRQFSLDLNTGNVVSDGKRFKISPSQVRIEDGELFVPTKLLSQWFPLDIKANLRALDVTIVPKENTAVDERIERKKRQFGSVYQVYAKNPEHKTAYKAFTVPSVSASFGVGYSDSQNVGSSGSMSLRAYGDLAYMAGELAILANEDGLTDARLSLARRNPRGGLLGQMDATVFELGDISGKSLPLISGGSSGRGLHIARRPAGYVGNLDTISLDGLLAPDYSVELYRNNILINAKQSGTGTKYEFRDLELLAGQNEFRIEFYGPQGQRRTEVKRFYVGAGQLKKGEINYDINVSQPNRTVFDVGLSASGQDKIYASARVDYGVSRKLTVSGGIASVPIIANEQTLSYGFIGASTQLAGINGNFDFVSDEKGGTAWSIKTSTKLGNSSLSAKYNQYNNGFVSNRTDADDTGRQLSSTLNLSADSHSIKLSKNSYFSVGARASQNNFTDGEWSRQFGLNMSNQIKNLMVANSMIYSQYSNDTDDRLEGQFQLNTRVGKLQLRLSSDYALKPEAELQQLQAGASYPFKNGYQASVNFKENYKEDTQSFTASLNKQFKFLSVGLSATQQRRADQEDDTSVYLTASFSTFTDPKTRNTTFRSTPGVTGASRVTAFLDENRDGLFNVSESPVPDVNIGGYNTSSGKTDANGQALITTNFFSDWTDLYLDAGSMPEADLMPSGRGRSVLNRPGVVSEIHLPIYKTGDVEGNITLTQSGSESTRPLSNLEVQALQRNPSTGKMIVVAKTFSAYDGFYSLTGIPIGKVQIRIDPEQLNRLAVKGRPQINLVLKKGNNFIEDQNFKLTR